MSMNNNSNQSMASSAGKVSLATAVSRIMGLAREQVQAYFFGAGMATDAFVTAFRIPNLLRDLFAEGALSSAFIPIFKEKMVRQGKEEAYKLANYTLSNLVAVVSVVVALGIIFTPEIIYVSAKGFTEDPLKFELTINLTRIMFIFLLLVSISAVQMGILNSAGHFGVPALSPTLFNVGMIISPILLYSYFSMPIYTLAIGVIIGGIGQIVSQMPSLHSIGYKYKFDLNFKDEGVRKVGRLLSPMVLGLSASRINILVNTLLASFCGAGAISYLNYAFRLMHFPLGVFGVALGTVALPKISEHVARDKTDELAKTFHEAFGLSMFLIVPSAVYLAGFGKDIIRLIYERGAFDASDTINTATALFFYSFGLIGFAGVRVAAPVYYALGDARRPMYYSVISVALNIVMNFAFIPLWGFGGLAAATSISGLANLFLLVKNMKAKINGLNYAFLGIHLLKTIVAALAALLLIKLLKIDSLIGLSNIWRKIIVISIQIAVMGFSYIFLLWIMKVDEVKKLVSLIQRKF